MGLQETSDILITFFQNIILLLNIPSININWPNELKVPMEYIQAFVDFDMLQTIAAVATSRAEELDVHITLIVKNCLLPLIVSVLVIIPMKRWYFVTWWAIALFFACSFAGLTATMSYFAQKPMEINWLTNLHYQAFIYNLGYKPDTPLPPNSYTVKDIDTPFDPLTVGLLSGGVAIALLLFIVTIGLGILLWIIRLILQKRKFDKALNEMKQKAPPGKKVNMTKLRYRMVYDAVRQKQQEELEFKMRAFWTRIAPLFLILIGEVIAICAVIWMKDYLDDNSPDSTVNSTFVYAIFSIVIVVICLISCCFLCLNSLVLFERMRKFIFKLNHFITGKALKLTFLVLSSFYIPLSFSIFTLFDCAQVSCPEGSVFTNRKDDIVGTGYFSRILGQLIRKPQVCTSCQYDLPMEQIFLHNSTATGFAQCSNSTLTSLCSGGTESRLLRQPSISCRSVYPYVAAAGGLGCLFVIATPVLILYLIKLATKQLGSVEIPHLLKYYARKKRRAMKNRMEKAQKRLVKPDQLPALESILNNTANQLDRKTKAKNPLMARFKQFLANNALKDLAWEIRVSLVDCSIESLYFPFKYKWRYYKLIFLVAKVVLSFTNVFGVTLFGTLEANNNIGPQIVLWTTLVVQFILGMITFIIRPHVILAESILMIVCSISIIANCIFGLVLLYGSFEAPAWVALAFMGVNSIVLAFAAVMSIVFYVYRLRANNWKGVQNKMKKLLKARASMSSKKKKQTAEKKIEKYWKGIGRKKREPFLDPHMIENSKHHLKELKSAQKYQKAVAYSLNRTSLDTLINFFVFLSIITSIAGLLICAHYVVLFLNPGYVDPYIQNRIRLFNDPLDIEQKGAIDLSIFVADLKSKIDTTSRPLLRNDTESELEDAFAFGWFPSSTCISVYNYTFAGYDNWTDFTNNCCCTRDLTYEKNATILEGVAYRDLEVEQWRCNNGLVKRHIRKAEVQFSAIASSDFIIGADNFVDNYISLDGYAMRGFCEIDFNHEFSFDYSKERDCAGKKTLEEYQEESADLANDAEPWSDPMWIGPHYVGAYDGMFDNTTILASSKDVENREFYGVVWDSVKSIIARTLFY